MKRWNGLVLYVMMVLVFLAGYGFRGVQAQQSSLDGKSADTFPPDVHSESRSRMPWAHRDDYSSEQEKAAFDHVVKLAPQAQNLKGPIGVMGTRLHLPLVAESSLSVSNLLHDNSGLDMRYVEISILISAREANNGYEWLQHEKSSIKVLPRETVEIIRNKKDLAGLDEKDAAVIQLGREMYHEQIVSSKTMAAMERLFGKRGTLASVLLIGNYSGSAMMLHAYNQQLIEGDKWPFATR